MSSDEARERGRKSWERRPIVRLICIECGDPLTTRRPDLHKGRCRKCQATASQRERRRRQRRMGA